MVLELLEKSSVTQNVKKCAFFTNRIDCLGDFIKPGRLEVANHADDAMRELKVAATVTEVQ